jgi:hypothetical protein
MALLNYIFIALFSVSNLFEHCGGAFICVNRKALIAQEIQCILVDA